MLYFFRSLSNIVIVTRMKKQPTSQTIHLTNEANKVRQAFFMENLSNIKFDDNTYKALKAIIDVSKMHLPRTYTYNVLIWHSFSEIFARRV